MSFFKNHAVHRHYYCPIAYELRNADHLFGIPRICGYEWNDAETQYAVSGAGRGGRERALFKYTISGAGELELNGRRFPLHPGDAFLLAGAVDEDGYSYRILDGADHWEFLFISFDKPYAVDIVRKIIEDCGNTVSLDAAGEAVGRAWQLLDLFKTGEIHDRYAVSRLGYGFLMSLCSETLTVSGKTRGTELLHRVAGYCYRHLSRPVSIDELAHLCGYSRYHFSRIFRQASGMAPSDFIMEQKLTAALYFLQQGQLSIKELAGRCGFQDASYFSRCFKRRFGVTPRHFDKITRQGNEND